MNDVVLFGVEVVLLVVNLVLVLFMLVINVFLLNFVNFAGGMIGILFGINLFN